MSSVSLTAGAAGLSLSRPRLAPPIWILNSLLSGDILHFVVLTDLIRTLSHFEQKQGGSDLRLQPPLFCMKFSGAAGDWGWLRPLRPVSAGETASPRFPPPVVNQKSQIVPNIVKF